MTVLVIYFLISSIGFPVCLGLIIKDKYKKKNSGKE